MLAGRAVLTTICYGEWNMTTFFSRLIFPLIAVLGICVTIPAHAKAFKVTSFQLFDTSANDTEGYVTTGANGSQCCVFFVRGIGKDGTPMIMALATALQMNQAVAWFYGTNAGGSYGQPGSGIYGDFEDIDNGGDLREIELYKDPATLPANVKHGTPFDLYASPQQLTWFGTCKPGLGVACEYGAYPGYTGGHRDNFLLAHSQWLNYIGAGASMHVGALGAIFSAFSGQYGIMIDSAIGDGSIDIFSPYFS
jgi:hypothetical protein